MARHRIAVLGALLLWPAWAGSAPAQERFAQPEDASRALVEAAAAAQPGFVDRIFGPGAKDLLSSGDPDRDREKVSAFSAAAAEATELVARNDTTRVLRVGRTGFEFPIPIVKRGDAWMFDIEAGRQEILDRAIGENELHAIEACHTYVAAQREYVRQDHDGDGVLEYAQRIISSPGRQDGLYWPPASQGDVSPLEGRISQEILDNAGQGRSYFGYRFRILKAQGRSAPGGAHSYVINGNMIAGFALLAYPVKWGQTGIMSFICNQSGVVLQQDLGKATARLARRIQAYDPDSSWVPAEAGASASR